MGVTNFFDETLEYPKIKNDNKRVLSEETAYQMVAILRGAVEGGLQKNLKP